MGTTVDGTGAKQSLYLNNVMADSATRARLVSDHLALVRRLCRRFSYTGEPLEDLMQVGTIGLLKGIDKFDPDRGSKFTAFAIPVITGEIKNYFRDHGWGVKVPRKLQRQRMVVEKSIEHLSQILGHSPNVIEISEATGLTEDVVFDTFSIENFGRPLSLDAQFDSNGHGDVSSILDFLGHEDPRFSEMISKIDLANLMLCLDPREKEIIRLKFYSGLSQTEIAGCLGISQMHVSRLQRIALNKLKVNMLQQ